MATDTQSDSSNVRDDTVTDQSNDRISELQSQLEQANEAKLRALADFQNYRKRMDAERAAMKEQANSMLMHSLADIIDDYYRSVKHSGKDAGPEKQLDGLSMVFEKLEGVLKDIGLEVIEVNEGDRFDPETMEAITTMPAHSEKEDNTVMHVESKGYKKSNGTVFRTAKVVTARYQS
ncbi:MAG: Protein GrpE [candidate division WS6 bacterium OLB20]|uniref:Protein GrpE n=1 Tax=candidate division WS6 bacterium OLB20 TaxID=1617426 RepID=A0A136M0P6_9BACT|nr:MAG: Protein GrpE [candidate division WS6 bacterium OLB20]